MTSRNKSSFGTKHYSEISSHREGAGQEDKLGITETQRAEQSFQPSNMLNSNNTHFSYENIHSNGENFVEMCNELNEESKKENQRALTEYIMKKAEDLASEFVGVIRERDQKRIQKLEAKLNSTETTNRSDESEVVEESRKLENLRPEFLKMMRTLHTQCTTYIELVNITKSLSDELKIRLKKIYNVMRAELETVLKNRQFMLKDNSAFLEFIKGKESYLITKSVLN
jgi:ABC-type sugar transport system ATPase subunit